MLQSHASKRHDVLNIFSFEFDTSVNPLFSALQVIACLNTRQICSSPWYCMRFGRTSGRPGLRAFVWKCVCMCFCMFEADPCGEEMWRSTCGEWTSAGCSPCCGARAPAQWPLTPATSWKTCHSLTGTSWVHPFFFWHRTSFRLMLICTSVCVVNYKGVVCAFKNKVAKWFCWDAFRF